MNVTEGTSGATIEPGEEKPKTFDDYLNEAENLYKKCKPLIEYCMEIVSPEVMQGIHDNDDGAAIIKKVNANLNLQKQLQDAMDICRAKESIDKALERGNTRKAKELKSAIDTLFKRAVGPEFQLGQAMVVFQRSALADKLWERYDDAAKIASNTSNKKNILLKDRLGKLKEKFPSLQTCFWDAMKELINYEKRFSNDPSSANFRDVVRVMRKRTEDDMLSSLQHELSHSIQSTRAHPYCLRAPAHSTSIEFAKSLAEEGITESVTLLDKAVRSVREFVDYAELLSDPQTLQVDPDTERVRVSSDQHELNLNLLTAYQAKLAFWHSTELVKRVDFSMMNEEVKNNLLLIDKATRRLTTQVILSYPEIININDQRHPSLSGSAREKRLSILEKCYEFLGCECHRLTGGVSKKNAETLSKLGDALSGAGESIAKELDITGQRILFLESDVRKFIDALFDVKKEQDIDDKTRGEETSLDIDDEGPSHRSVEDISLDEAASLEESLDRQERRTEREPMTDQAGRDIDSGSVPSIKEERTIARLAHEVQNNKDEKERRRRKANEEKKSLEKIEQRLAERIEKLDRIKQAFKEGAHIRYLAWDLENAPEEAARLAQLAQRKALNLAVKLAELEEWAISKGAVSEESHRNEISEYERKADEYEEVKTRCDSDAKALRIASIKASLGIEAVRKSNAAKRLLTELVDLEKGPETLKVTMCKTLPKYPQAKNQFGILETKDGQPIYDHVVEFRVGLEKVPEFLVHFHFRHPLAAGKTPDYYVEKMEIHDWNVQAAQKQETEEKVRFRQLEAGKKVISALQNAWKKSLEVNRGNKKDIAAGAVATPGSTVSASSSGKQKKKKGKARGK
jgi:hypothetical protein